MAAARAVAEVGSREHRFIISSRAGKHMLCRLLLVLAVQKYCVLDAGLPRSGWRGFCSATRCESMAAACGHRIDFNVPPT